MRGREPIVFVLLPLLGLFFWGCFSGVVFSGVVFSGVVFLGLFFWGERGAGEGEILGARMNGKST